MWTKVWLLLGREAEIPNHGDWQMEEVGPEEILMVRQKDGGVKAFYNVCQHRANPLVDDGPVFMYYVALFVNTIVGHFCQTAR